MDKSMHQIQTMEDSTESEWIMVICDQHTSVDESHNHNGDQ